MVSMKTLVGAGLAALPSASAYIYGMEAPATAVAGSTIKANLMTASYVQNFVDFSVIWGISPSGGGSCARISASALRSATRASTPSKCPSATSPSMSPSPRTPRPATTSWSLPSPFLVGASGVTKVHAFNATIAVTAA
ncbi:hypothetical protein PG995_003972 [Apiospora arundinis]